ncbi:ubiquitin carboxyl-terminal hydrolase CYLD [Microcaecilia unicolor]|uniref:Ubiquitin carboxyl-terminal hydrolase CYLD-like n=1 Tax=Microcaecilia unicolor TaxID=1415580 RepID=A0A6P7Z0W5_9AMPH|nr:ubiquitin carboxyl-terminal hydrolase CYLD-like [Microcaecilia unicolor]
MASKGKAIFIVMREFTAGKQKISLGSLGFFLDTKQRRARIVDLKSRLDVPVKRTNIKAVSRREAGFLYGISSLQRRYEVVAREKLFMSICSLEVHDVIRLKCKGTIAVGIVASFWELCGTAGHHELTKLLIEVDLLEEEVGALNNQNRKVKIDAGDILVVSSCVRSYPHYQHHKLKEINAVLEDVAEAVPPVQECETGQKMMGLMRGIQGNANSCYLDSTLFSLFSFSSVLDCILHSSEVYDEKVQQILRRDIVNPLRKHGFVRAENVMKLRKLLRCDTFITDEKDPEEFLSVLLQEILSIEPLLKIRSNNKTQKCNIYQIIMEKDEAVNVPTVQYLLEKSFLSCDLKFDEIPSCLMLQMPRFGKNFKMFPFIFPSMELDITDLLYKKPSECFICSGPAEYECGQCMKDPLLAPGPSKQFCHLCERQVHSHKERREHKAERIESTRGLHRSSISRKKLQLFAVLCIKTSHYVSFVRYGPNKRSWVFFDSMAGRLGDEKGSNVPAIQPCPQLGHYLAMSEEQFAALDLTQIDILSKRFFSDAYMCMYQNPDNSA